MQPMGATGEDAFKFESPISTAKYGHCVEGLDKVVALIELIGVDHVAIGMDYWFGQAGIASDELAQKLYDYFISRGEWQASTYPPRPWWFPRGVETPDKLANLTGALLARGYSEKDVAKIWGGNWLRIMKEVWG